MAMDTFMAYVGVYDDVEAAKADYATVHDLHVKDQLIDAYDAAVIERKDNGKVKIVKKHETPTRVGGVGGATVGLATGLVIALFPAAAIGSGLLLGTGGIGAALGAVAGHAAAGMSRKDLKELGEQLDAGQAGLVVVGVSDMGAKIEAAMTGADKVEAKELSADVDAIAEGRRGRELTSIVASGGAGVQRPETAAADVPVPTRRVVPFASSFPGPRRAMSRSVRGDRIPSLFSSRRPRPACRSWCRSGTAECSCPRSPSIAGPPRSWRRTWRRHPARGSPCSCAATRTS